MTYLGNISSVNKEISDEYLFIKIENIYAHTYLKSILIIDTYVACDLYFEWLFFTYTMVKEEFNAKYPKNICG